MKVSYIGLLNNAAADLERGTGHSEGGRAFGLRELAKNLDELRERTVKGDYTALDEFFNIYVGQGGQPYTRLAEP